MKFLANQALCNYKKLKENIKIFPEKKTEIFQCVEGFNNVSHNSVALDAFVEVMTVTNQIKLRYAELTRYSSTTSCLVLLQWLEARPRKLRFFPYLAFAWSSCSLKEKFLQPSGYCTVINCAFISRSTNDFSYFRGVTTQFEFVKQKFLN